MTKDIDQPQMKSQLDVENFELLKVLSQIILRFLVAAGSSNARSIVGE